MKPKTKELSVFYSTCIMLYGVGVFSILLSVVAMITKNMVIAKWCIYSGGALIIISMILTLIRADGGEDD